MSSSAVWLLAASATRSVGKEATEDANVGHIFGHSLNFAGNFNILCVQEVTVEQNPDLLFHSVA